MRRPSADLETFWRNLRNGVSGIGRIQAFDTSAFDCQIAGEIRDFEPKNYFKNAKDVRRTDRYTHLAMAAAKMAMEDSGLDLEKTDRKRFGAIVSSGIGGLKTLEEQHTTLITRGPSRVSAFTIPMLISNMASGFISMEYGLRVESCIVTACATSNNAIGESWRIIKFGDADMFLAGGASLVVAIGLAGFSAMKALSTRNDEWNAPRAHPTGIATASSWAGAGRSCRGTRTRESARREIYCELTGPRTRIT